MAQRPGIQTNNSKLTISRVRRREESGALIPDRMAIAARKKPIVVAQAQNSWEGGIQLGMKFKRPGMSYMWTTPKEIAERPNRRAKRNSRRAMGEPGGESDAKRTAPPATSENSSKKLPVGSKSVWVASILGTHRSMKTE